MHIRTGLFAAALTALACTWTAPAVASDPTGVYALIDSVSFEPGEGPPERVQVKGLFCVAQGDRGGAYTSPRRGSILFGIEPGQEEDTRKQWRELAAAAGIGKVVTFGRRWTKGEVSITPDRAEVRDPLPFDTGMGVQVLRSGRYGPSALLRTMPRPVSPTEHVELRWRERYGPVEEIVLQVENCVEDREGLRYLFEVERENGDVRATGPVAPGKDGRTEHRMYVHAKDGERLKWRARVVHTDLPEVSVARASFVVRKKDE